MKPSPAPAVKATATATPTATPPLRIGILACANIARAFTRDVAPSPAVRVVAVASRQQATADAFAQAQGIQRALGSYEALLADAEVDAVYIPLPNSLHAEWAIAAAAQGKHVLCEKPLALGHAQAAAMFSAARQHGVMLLEAYPYWFQPQTGALLALLQSGAIGTPRSVQASFGFTLAQPLGNIRMAAHLGGGALLDAGSYPLSLIRLVMGSAPVRVQATARWAGGAAGSVAGADADEFGPSSVDIAMTATLHYADGRQAQMSCAMDSALHRHAQIVGSDGVIQTEYLNHTADPAAGGAHPHGFQPSLMRLRRAGSPPRPFETVASPGGSGFRFAAEAFAQVVARRDFAAIDRAAAASLDIAATLEALALSARQGRTVDLPPASP